MARGTLWTIYDILQFINRIIVTLHFFVGSKLFYFSEFSNFDFRMWIRGVDLVGVGIIKNKPTLTGGRGGFKPPRPVTSRVDEVARHYQHEMSRVQLSIDSGSSVQLPRQSWKDTKKTGIWPKVTKIRKNTKFVWMTSYSQGRLSKKSASQKYQFSIFRTNEGDFGGIPLKNQ